ncbi:hypothetical protein NUM_07110 [Actinocatenispora comari]|jgi:hypothetical protein|uniref:Uncharacterized protein n=2 Tax=Actinocatenispora comari TaxID=2807577 RepID=A0A8J4A5V4_9ACTN|nr:hypothetical protein NUM_07110 [Actinocatenispora comari]
MVLAPQAQLSRPPFGAVGNGLQAQSWVPLLDLAPGTPGRWIARLLLALREAGVPACAAPATGTAVQRRRPWRIWVDVPSRTRGEDVLRRLFGRSGHTPFARREDRK